MPASIVIENISKRYDKTQALDHINLTVHQGELFGLIGPDGAGKTSLIRILATLILADEGKATVCDHDVVKDYKTIRKLMGYMPGRFSLYQDLTVLENLQLFAAIYGTTIEKSYHLIKDIYSQIEPFKHRRAGKLSGGMKQKLALSCAMIHEPEILFLDEPTTGVDPVSRKEFWGMLKKLQESNITILVSTPYMDEAGMCDRVALIQEGKILSVNTPEEIVNEFSKPLFSIIAKDKYRLIHDLRDFEYANSVFSFGEAIHYTDKREQPDITELENYLNDKDHKGVEIKPIPATIEDSFMELMRQE